jgi:hypothetical protein
MSKPLCLLMALPIILILASMAGPATAQSRTMYLGSAVLRLGMTRAATMKLLAKYRVTEMGSAGSSSIVTEYDERTKKTVSLGAIGFDHETLTYISREISTSDWPKGSRLRGRFMKELTVPYRKPTAMELNAPTRRL